MSTVVNILIAVLVFSLLILVHELGHFLLAKAVGVGVTEFSLGMGPRLLSFGKGETKYSLKLIPFGGSCAMVGEDEENPAPNAFNNKPAWARFLVIFAGPFFNLVFAFLIAVPFILMSGINTPRVYSVTRGGGAEAAGIERGDIITSVDGHRIRLGRDLELYLLTNDLDPETEVRYLRDGKEQTVTVKTAVSAYRIGISYTNDENPAALAAVSEGSPAAEAGLKEGDIILSLNGAELASGSEMAAYFEEHSPDGSPISVAYSRNGVRTETSITPALYEGKDLGLGASYWYDEVSGFGQLIRYSFEELGYWVRYVFISLRMLVTGRVGIRDMSGAVGIVSTIGTVVDTSMKEGGFRMVVVNLFMMIVLLNVNLGIMNLLPIPALDGGRLVFILIELITGKPVPPKYEGIVHAAGLVILLIFMVVVMFSDVLRLFGR